MYVLKVLNIGVTKKKTENKNIFLLVFLNFNFLTQVFYFIDSSYLVLCISLKLLYFKIHSFVIFNYFFNKQILGFEVCTPHSSCYRFFILFFV